MKLTEEWKVPSLSNGGGNCVQARLFGGAVEIRNSNDPSGPFVKFTPDEWDTFRRAVREQDEFQI